MTLNTTKPLNLSRHFYWEEASKRLRAVSTIKMLTVVVTVGPQKLCHSCQMYPRTPGCLLPKCTLWPVVYFFLYILCTQACTFWYWTIHFWCHRLYWWFNKELFMSIHSMSHLLLSLKKTYVAFTSRTSRVNYSSPSQLYSYNYCHYHYWSYCIDY